MVPVPTEVPSLPLLDGNAVLRHFLWSEEKVGGILSCRADRWPCLD